MKTAIKYLIVFCLMSTTFWGCSKKGTVEVPDTTKPTIMITKPTQGQAFVAGNTVTFQATFTDNEKLKSYAIAISKKVTGALILKIYLSVDFTYNKPSTNFTTGVKQQEIILNDIVIPANTATNITAPGTYKINVTCVDGSDNVTTGSVDFVIN